MTHPTAKHRCHHDFPWAAQGTARRRGARCDLRTALSAASCSIPPPRTAAAIFSTVIGKLDYIADLGINPRSRSCRRTQFPGSNRMATTPDIFAIEANYGGPRVPGAGRCCASARHRRVIYDVFNNHLGPSDLDLWQFDGWSDNLRAAASTSIRLARNERRGATPARIRTCEVRQFLRDNVCSGCRSINATLRFDATG